MKLGNGHFKGRVVFTEKVARRNFMWILLHKHFIPCLSENFHSTLGPTAFSGVTSAFLFCQIC